MLRAHLPCHAEAKVNHNLKECMSCLDRFDSADSVINKYHAMRRIVDLPHTFLPLPVVKVELDLEPHWYVITTVFWEHVNLWVVLKRLNYM